MKFSATLNRTIAMMIEALMTSPSAADMPLATSKMIASGFASRISSWRRGAVRFAGAGSLGPNCVKRRFASTCVRPVDPKLGSLSTDEDWAFLWLNSRDDTNPAASCNLLFQKRQARRNASDSSRQSSASRSRIHARSSR